MFFTRLQLYQFKNYSHQEFVFDKRLVCITGKNGCGKTTILDALHFLSFTKSYFLHQDQLSVKHEHQGMRIAGHIQQQDETSQITCILRENGKKDVLLNEVPYTKFSEHIGRFPCIFICPDDTQLITEGSEGRRRFLDIACSLIHPEYIVQLNQYNKILLQRNSLLKQVGANISTSLLTVYNQQLANAAQPIYNLRKEVSLELGRITKQIYLALSEQQDAIQMEYVSALHEKELLTLLEQNLQKDIYSQRTNAGIHKDDWHFEINDMPMKQAASQGQRKSFIFGIKLALFHFIQERLQKKAVLLLDDFFEKLDEQRAHRLINYIEQLDTQVFITDTHKERVEAAFASFKEHVQRIDLE